MKPEDPGYHEWYTCLRKKKYNSFDDAGGHLARRRGKRRHVGRWLRDMQAYRCQYCGKIHTGHQIGEQPVRLPMRVRKREALERAIIQRAAAKARSKRSHNRGMR